MVEYFILAVHVLISLVVILLVAFQDYRAQRNQVLVVTVLLFTLFSVANTLSLIPWLDQLFLIRMVMVTTSLSLLSLYFLIEAIPNKNILTDKMSYVLGIPTVIVAAIDASPLLFSNYIPGTPPQPVAGPLVSVFFIHFIVMAIATVIKLRDRMRQAKGREIYQYRLILLGLAPIALLAPITGLILPLIFHNTALIILSPLYTLFFIVCISYAIAKHGLFDVKFAAVRSSAYILSLVSLACIYYFMAYLVSIILFQNQAAAVSSNPINIALALLLAFIFQPIRAFFDKITDRIFFRNRYNPELFYEQLSEVLTSTTDLRTLTQRAAHEISSALKASDTFFFVRYGKAHHITSGTTKRTAVGFEAIRDLDAYCANLEERLIVTDLLRDEDSRAQDYLKKHNIAILMPLVSRRSIIGYLFLGEQKAGGYTNRDIRVLRTISDQLTIAIQNSLSIQEVRDVNQGLQQRIDTATKELRTSNLRLKKLDLAKNEFLSMASHQLRTPLTSMKGYVSMVLEGDAGEINPTQRKLLEQAFTSSQRMVYLIGDFLNVSRLQTGKFELEKSQIDLAHLIEDEVEQLETTAKLRAITLRYEKTCNELILQIDATKLRQVIMNFIDNALYYSPEGTTVVVRFTVHGGDARFEVRDQGIGVPKVEQHNLFTKFYRASNAKRTRPDGTGIGLFMAKKVIIAHGGSMLFESREGKGSTFGFVLPVKNQRSRFDNKPNN